MTPNKDSRTAARKMRTGALSAMTVGVGALPVMANDGRDPMDNNFAMLAKGLEPECLQGEAYEIREGNRTVQVRSVMMPLAYVLAGQRLMRSTEESDRVISGTCRLTPRKD